MNLLKLKNLLLLFIGLSVFKTFAQTSPGTVFSVAGNPVSTEEFERQLIKSLPYPVDSIQSKYIDEYLKLYVDFKLKYQDAKDAKLDTVAAYNLELAGYRRDLARNYLYDKEVTESLINEAYSRMQWEVRAQHILITIKENPTPADTLAAFNKIQALYTQLQADPSKFNDLAKASSDDPGTKEAGGDLGYFTALQLVYPFENNAYNTEIGKISPIFRSQFGYHILKVTDKRKNRGEIKTRHILLRVGHKPDATDENVKKTITEIYNKIKSGEATFESMAQYSEDYNSKYNGGELDYFTTTQFVGDPERQKWADMAFSLKANKDMTEPFRTSYGWHILQRLDVHPLGTLNQLKLTIKNQIQMDQRSQKSVDALVQKVKTENHFTNYPASLDAFISSLDTNFVKGKFKASDLPEFAPAIKPIGPKKGNVFKEPAVAKTPLRNLNMFTLDTENHTVSEFAAYVESSIKPCTSGLNACATNLYNEWVNTRCVDYQDRHLEERNPEFKFLYQEYREGILMFNRMQEKVWDKANSDTTGLLEFYNLHKGEYMWTDRFDAVLFLCASEKIMKNVEKGLKKKLAPDSIKRSQNKQKPLNSDYRMGKYELSDSFLFPDKRILETLFANPAYRKANKIVKLNKIGNDWVVVKVNKFIPASAKLLDETRGPVAAKYQDFLEKKWIESLHGKYKVEINNEAVQAIKTKLVH